MRTFGANFTTKHSLARKSELTKPKVLNVSGFLTAVWSWIRGELVHQLIDACASPRQKAHINGALIPQVTMATLNNNTSMYFSPDILTLSTSEKILLGEQKNLLMQQRKETSGVGENC